MKAIDLASKMTRHSPKVVIVRDRAHLMVGEPRCGARIGPGATTNVDAFVTCDACIDLLEGEQK